jgi:hypothetical protein
MPEMDPSGAAQQAVSEADTDGDGALSQAELEQIPGLLSELKLFDTNSDGALTAEELERELRDWADHGAALRSLDCYVTLKGRPLSDALVEFIPEPFLGGGIKPATGTTNRQGRVVMSLSKEDLPADLQSFRGVNLGVYRVRVTHPKRDIPAKYNTESILGQTVSRRTQDVQLKL